MATLFQIRRGSGSVSLTDGEIYLHKGSGSLQVALGTTPITLARLNDINSGSLSLSGDVSASNMFVSGNLTVSGNLFLGNTSGDNISVPGVFTTNLVPGSNGTLNLGTEGAKWNTIYANSVTASISGSVNNVNITALSTSVDSRLNNLQNFTSSANTKFDNLATISGSLILTASVNTISITNINSFTASITGGIDKVAYFDTNKSLKSYINSYLGSQTFGLGTSATSSGAPERLMVANSGDESYNIATFQGAQNNTYAQVNIKNFGSGSQSSTDLVLWNDVSSESSSYFDIGINSSIYSGGEVGFGGDAYIYNAHNDTYIGSITTGSHGHLHLFGGGRWIQSAITVYSDGTIGVNTDKFDNNASTIPTSEFAVEISGSVKFDNSVHIVGNISSSIITSIHATTASLILHSESVNSRFDSLATISGSLIQTASLNTISIQNLNSYSSSLKTAFEFTGSNVVVLGDFTVKGTTTSINSTAIVLGDNVIELNGTSVANGGLLVKDPTGISTISGSLLWDSTNDYWKGGTLGNETKIMLAGGDNVFTSSLQLTNLNQTTQSLNDFSASVTASLIKLYESTASLNLYTESVNSDLGSIHQTTSSLNLFSASVTSSLTSIYQTTASLNESSASLNLFSASVTASLVKVYESTASLNLFSASVTSSLEKLYESTASLNLYTQSVNNDLASVHQTTASLNLFSASVTASLTKLYEATSSLNVASESLQSFSSSALLRLSSLETETGSLETRFTTLGGVTASLITATSSLFWTASNHETRLDSVEYTITILDPGNFGAALTSINTFTASTNTRLNALETYSASYAQYFTYSGSEFHIDFNV
jgi:hypothetical protein